MSWTYYAGAADTRHDRLLAYVYYETYDAMHWKEAAIEAGAAAAILLTADRCACCQKAMPSEPKPRRDAECHLYLFCRADRRRDARTPISRYNTKFY